MTAKRTDEDITIEEIERRFDNGEDVLDYFDTDNPIVYHPVEREDSQRQVNTSLPVWLIEFMDDEARRRGTSRKSVINNWLVDRADAERERRMAFA